MEQHLCLSCANSLTASAEDEVKDPGSLSATWTLQTTHAGQKKTVLSSFVYMMPSLPILLSELRLAETIDCMKALGGVPHAHDLFM